MTPTISIDIERQAGLDTTCSQDVAAQTTKSNHSTKDDNKIEHQAETDPKPVDFKKALDKPGRDLTKIRQNAGQCCFLCLETREHGQFAIRVPCQRLTTARCPERIRVYENGKTISTILWKLACESDTEIYHRLVDTCYEYMGWWKRWVPYYGVTDVAEVEVSSFPCYRRYSQDDDNPHTMFSSSSMASLTEMGATLSMPVALIWPKCATAAERI